MTQAKTKCKPFNKYGVYRGAAQLIAFGTPTAKVSARIQHAKLGRCHIAEFSYRFRCGGCHGAYIPLSIHSVGFSLVDDAVKDCANRMLADMKAKMADISEYPVVQQREYKKLVKAISAFAT